MGSSGHKSEGTDGYRELLSQVWRLRKEVSNMEEAMRAEVKLAGRGGKSAAQVASSDVLSISTAAAAATLRSREEVNTESGLNTSYATPSPAFEGASTSQATIGGAYDGSSGNDTLSFTVTKAGNVGGPNTGALGLLPADLELEVRDGAGELLDTLQFTEESAPDTEMALGNGLTVSFSAGSLELGDSFDLGVAHSVAGSAAIDEPMNGRGGDDANFDLGERVVDGSFEVNGVSIAVNASDSIREVLERITASAAGVSAAFDAGSDEVVLTHKTVGAAGNIVLSGDSSGFLAASKLSGASQVDGEDNEFLAAIDTVGALSGLSSGTFYVEGQEFSIDTSVDSLSDILDSVNEAQLGVRAAYTGSRIVFTAEEAQNSFSLAEGTSGFFAAFGIEVGSFKPGELSGPASGVSRPGKSPGKVRSASQSIEKRFGALKERLQEFFGEELGGSASAKAMRKTLRSSMGSALRGVLRESLDLSASQVGQGTVDTGFGLVFNFDANGGNPFLELRESEIFEGVRRNQGEVKEFLFGKKLGEQQGFFAAVDAALAASQKSLALVAGESVGTLFVAYA